MSSIFSHKTLQKIRWLPPIKGQCTSIFFQENFFFFPQKKTHQKTLDMKCHQENIHLSWSWSRNETKTPKLYRTISAPLPIKHVFENKCVCVGSTHYVVIIFVNFSD